MHNDDEGKVKVERTRIMTLRESIDSLLKYKVDQKNAEVIKAGRKIVDKEGEIYGKLLSLP